MTFSRASIASPIPDGVNSFLPVQNGGKIQTITKYIIILLIEIG